MSDCRGFPHERLHQDNEMHPIAFTIKPKRIFKKFFDTEFCPPSPPILGGTRIYLLVKVPQTWGI
ncbi:MAG: hypothetical protein F6J99_38490 [Moorea sp. SIO4G3]|nr:hypothetical protein [Moorena sp. SIO4G3]